MSGSCDVNPKREKVSLVREASLATKKICGIHHQSGHEWPYSDKIVDAIFEFLAKKREKAMHMHASNPTRSPETPHVYSERLKMMG